MKRKLKRLLPLCILSLALLLSACGSGDAKDESSGAPSSSQSSVQDGADGTSSVSSHVNTVFTDGKTLETSFGFGLEYPAGYTHSQVESGYMIYPEDMDMESDTGEVMYVLAHSEPITDLFDQAKLDEIAKDLESNEGKILERDVIEYDGIKIALFDINYESEAQRQREYLFNLNDATYSALAMAVNKDFDETTLYDDILKSFYIL